MKKALLILFICVFSVSMISAALTPSGDDSLYYFEFTKTGENALWFFDGNSTEDNPTAENSFSFPIVSTPTSSSVLKLGLYYQVYVDKYKLSVIFSSDAYGTEGPGHMLTHTTNEDVNLNYKVSVTNADDSSVIGENINPSSITDALDLSERTLVLIDTTNSENTADSSNGKIYMDLTVSPPDTTNGETSGQYSGNVYLVLDTY